MQKWIWGRPLFADLHLGPIHQLDSAKYGYGQIRSLLNYGILHKSKFSTLPDNELPAKNRKCRILDLSKFVWPKSKVRIGPAETESDVCCLLNLVLAHAGAAAAKRPMSQPPRMVRVFSPICRLDQSWDIASRTKFQFILSYWDG